MGLDANPVNVRSSALILRGRGKIVPRELARRTLSKQVAQRSKRGFAAPAAMLRHASAPTTGSERGFRQSAYFARAASMIVRQADNSSILGTWTALGG